MPLALAMFLSACSVQPAPTPTPALLPLPTPSPSPAVTAPAPTPVIIATLTPAPTPVTYVVQKGDTLVGIAVKFGVSIADLQAANPNVQPQFLSIGAVLVIPDPAGTPVLGQVDLPTVTPVPVSLSLPACYPTPTGALYCFVEARNPGGFALSNVAGRVTLAGAEGLPLASAVAYSALDVIPPGGVAPLAILFSPAPVGVAAAAASPLSASLASAQSAAIPLETPQHRGSNFGIHWTVAGQVRNPSGTDVPSAWLVLTLYNHDERIVGYRKGPLSGGLAAGASQDFSIAADSLGGAADHYLITAEGRP
ncbi:MAG TPA: LysM peptidoglycan-binding domain-containing protein [Anaerolineales bacterium]|nr:LysM peptidoglycan-binding domain-containing protein [Anaerolineales bacterium]